MEAGHLPENLLSYEETPGASETINKWVDEGHEVLLLQEDLLIRMSHQKMAGRTSSGESAFVLCR